MNKWAGVQWEYITAEIWAEVIVLGEKGWELVSVIPPYGSSWMCTYFMKRKIKQR